MRNKRFRRKCPQCNKAIFHKCKYTRNKHSKKGLLCNHCKSKKENLSNLTIKKRSISLKKVIHTWNDKIAENRKKNGTYIVSEETKEKHRINKIEKMIKNGVLIWPSYNENACIIFEKLEKYFKWNGFYATKGKEKRIGRFWVDYYEPNQNIVIEYDEPYHFSSNGKLKPKDIKRQKWIIKNIGCRFYRINKNTNYEQFKNFISSMLP